MQEGKMRRDGQWVQWGLGGLGKEGQSKPEQFKDVLVGVKAKQCFPKCKMNRFGFGWRRGDV